MRKLLYFFFLYIKQGTQTSFRTIFMTNMATPEKLYSVLFHGSDGLHLRTLRPSVKQGKTKIIF